MKRVMKKQKYCMLFGITLVYVLLFASCPNPLTPEDIHMPVDEGYGRISLNLVGGSQGLSQSTVQGSDGPSRTVLPTMAFTKYEYIFTRTGGSPVELAPDNNGFFTLEVGNYTVTVNAYIGNVGSHILVATGTSSQFSVGSGNNASVEVSLSSVNTGVNGTFTYTITYPAGAAADITLQRWPEMNDIVLNPVTQGNGKNQTLQLGAGSYLLTIRISKDGLFAGISEAIHIYPSLLTTFTRNFTENDILHPSTPGLAFTLISDGTAYSVSRGTANAANVIIPAVYNGLPVTSIATNGFRDYSTMTSITIPNSVTTIGWRAFQWCTSLTSITIPDSVMNIGDYAFQGCTSLVSVIIGNSVTWIGSSAFQGCTSLVSVIIGNSVTWIGNSAFNGCSSLTSVIIPNSVAIIGNMAFRNCTSLTSITIPNSVTSIGVSAFNQSGLTSIIIPDSITTILYDTFQGCTSLTSVTIPNSVTTIGDRAFSDCTSLTSVTIPNSVTTIGHSAFFNTSLVSIIIPDSITSIGANVFAFCSSLISVTIPNSVTSIGQSAFSRSGLTSITIPNSVTTIGNRAFFDCTSLMSITIPNSITSIGDQVFANCTSLTSITVDTANPNYSSLAGVLYNKTRTTLIQIPGGRSGSFIIPDSVTTIGDSAFQGCTSLTSVTIPDSITSIGDWAFWGCTSLTSVTFLGTISSSNFEDAFPGSNLREVYLAVGGGIGTYTRPAGGSTWTKQP
jgi:hypothetical protein